VLEVSDQSIRRWVKAGELKAYKPKKEYRIAESDLQEFLEGRAVPLVQAPLPDLEDERREYPYPWMASSLAWLIEYWTHIVESRSNPAYSRTIAVICFDVIDGVTLRHEENWEHLPEDEKAERRNLAERLDTLAMQGFAHYRASKAAQAAEVREIERRREEIRQRTRELSA
jgi:excisionase family DNA binding protein